eukprot:TRINITY_DN67197_c3_g11_i2.p1 TRINITY_DN67197_c3_g11~~TRINITY_DN67197_c3_g11_i2.p1  ORF type:complete len:592 (+),score=328.84 TRINITY_DN67197_c3_g11_i2:399-2174(+)
MSPARVHLCDGSDQENEMLLTQMVHSGTIIPVNKDIRPNSYVARSPLSDVARVEERTFICTENEEDAGFTNNWKEPEATQQQMTELFTDCMRGRTMYVVPFSMGPIGSEFSRIGVQITDSPYAVVSMRIMTRMGKEALDALGADGDFVPCVHSLGQPLTRGSADVPWPCDKDNKWIVHFPEQGRIWSYGSGYGGNALLGKKCLALRIASFMAREEGWLAEHMLIVGITNPEGDKKYVCGAFPSACGKTNLAMMNPNLPGWKVECVGDDIAWMRVKEGDGRLWAINPEAGFFGVAPGTSYKSNPNAMNMLKQNVIFTNVAIKPDGDVWWEDMTDEKPEQALSWLRTEWYPDQNTDAAHPNARFTVPASQCGVMDPNWESPEGVPVSAIVFGARRSSTMPLVYQARSWEHGVFMGATMNSETTAAAAGKRGVLRPDPFAMKPFCGYNMGDYFNHWLSFSERTDESQLPKIFHVNWFRKNSAGKFMWPGFGDNIRVIKWIFQRCDEDSVESDIATDSPIGFLPTEGSLDLSDLDVPAETMKSLFKVDPVEWKNEIARNQQFFDKFGDRLPARIQAQLDQLKTRIAQAEAAKPKQ